MWQPSSEAAAAASRAGAARGGILDLMAERIQHFEDGDSIVVRWGDGGKEHAFRPGDDQGMQKAFRSAVAEGLVHGETFEDEVERSIAREMQGQIGIRKDASDALILAWWPAPEVAAEIAKLGNGLVQDPSDLHLTLIYLGDPDTDGTEFDLQLVGAVTKLYTARTGWSNIEGTIGGLGRFVGPDDTDVVVALVDVPYLTNFRQGLLDDLCCYGALPWNSPAYNQEHGYVPHITLAYVPKGQASPPPMEETVDIVIDNVTLAAGPGRVTFPLYVPEYAEYAESAAPYYAARTAVAYTKAGRMLSGKNLSALKDAIGSLQTIHDRAMAAAGKEEDAPVEGTEKDARKAFFAEIAGSTPSEYGLEYLVTKAADEKRYTLGPLYAPDRKDAHGEFTDAETLQKSVWDYVQSCVEKGDNRLNLQHGDLGDIQVARWVECMAWPYEHTITVKTAGGDERELTMPAGTVYLGAIWDEDAWPLVKASKLNGWSLGGKAIRVSAEGDLPHMGDKVARRIEFAPDLVVSVEDETAKAAEREREMLRAASAADDARAAADRGMVSRLLDTLKVAVEKPAAPLHVHVPEQSVNISSADVDVIED